MTDASTDGALLELAGVQVSLPSTVGPVNILRGIDLVLSRGEAVAVVGPSGAGKSTLMMVVAGLERVSAGRISLAGHDLSALDEDGLDEAKRKRKSNVNASLRNKAKSANAPMGALRAIYNKGLAAWRTGHRPGVGQHQWAMARVNSVLAGGPARKVDAAQWKAIQNYRKNK